MTDTEEPRIVWITGASQGIGAATAVRLANQGDIVFASARTTEALDEIARSVTGAGKIIPLPLDVTDRAACYQAVGRILDEASRLDLIILNAGTFLPVSGKNLNIEVFEKTMELNFFGVLNTLVPCLDVMKEQGKGHIVVVSSVAGYGGLPKSAAYGASKAALINMMESLKLDLLGFDIKLQLVNPGFVDTPLTKKNEFPMPFLMPLEKSAERLAAELDGNGFEITFPRRFTWQIKLLNLLPYRLYFPMIAAMTGAGKKNPKT